MEKHIYLMSMEVLLLSILYSYGIRKNGVSALSIWLSPLLEKLIFLRSFNQKIPLESIIARLLFNVLLTSLLLTWLFKLISIEILDYITSLVFIIFLLNGFVGFIGFTISYILFRKK
ncbi:hypothetical protein [Paenibacillus sp. MMO-58]|uniref:hypothetical protein n=1 Tax=Paenibacillus sp. MMO-58 TaxID=3081290 RepID=UPI00301B1B98